jgi:hypothetical protein
MRKERSFRQRAQQLLDDSIRAGRSLAARHDGAVPAYERLLSHVQGRTTLLRPSRHRGDHCTALNAGLLALALHHADWLRPLESWEPDQQSAWMQFASLAHHLFAWYPVPAFMNAVWFNPPLGQILPQHRWYKHLGLGHSIRTAGLPLRITRAMAHLFGQVPPPCPAIAALRWAQVHGLGGNEPLARAVIATRLGEVLENEDFWESVLLFFVKHASLDLAQVRPVVDFLQHQKFQSTDGVSADGISGKEPPPRPDYSIKGRTVASLLRQVEQWHRTLGQAMRQPSLSWRHSPISDLRLVQDGEVAANLRIWTITELLDSRALFLEGHAMRHCVATYTERCVSRRTSIWSMQMENQKGRHRVLTIEVNLMTKTICQARQKGNRRPQALGRETMERWAIGQGLRIAESTWL